MVDRERIEKTKVGCSFSRNKRVCQSLSKVAKSQSILKKIKFTIATAFNYKVNLVNTLCKNEQVNLEEHKGRNQSLYRAAFGAKSQSQANSTVDWSYS